MVGVVIVVVLDVMVVFIVLVVIFMCVLLMSSSLLLSFPGELTGFLLRTVWLQREAKRPTTKGLCHRVYLPLNSRLSLVISRKLVKCVS